MKPNHKLDMRTIKKLTQELTDLYSLPAGHQFILSKFLGLLKPRLWDESRSFYVSLKKQNDDQLQDSNPSDHYDYYDCSLVELDLDNYETNVICTVTLTDYYKKDDTFKFLKAFAIGKNLLKTNTVYN